MYYRLSIISVLLCTLFVASACQPASPSETSPVQPGSRAASTAEEISPAATPNEVVSVLATPDVSAVEIEPGKAVVIGRILSAETSEPITDVPVRLAEIYYNDPVAKDPEQAAWVLSNANSPFTYSDAHGFFVFENVEARDYVVFVGDILNRYAVETNEAGTPRPRTVAPDQVTELGEITVDY